jgi:predicted CopG family antitoxin
MRKIGYFVLGALSLLPLNASDIMKDSMSIMQDGIKQIQYGFINHDESLVREGLVLIKKGNDMFSDKKIIKKYLPNNKEHTVNTAMIASKRIYLDINIIEGNLDEKAYTKAAKGYGDMLNACASCHGIIRSW